MKKTMHCMRCGCAAELDFTDKWQEHKCADCGVKFKYRSTKEGEWEFSYSREDLDDLYIGEEKFADVMQKAEGKHGGTV